MRRYETKGGESPSTTVLSGDSLTPAQVRFLCCFLSAAESHINSIKGVIRYGRFSIDEQRLQKHPDDQGAEDTRERRGRGATRADVSPARYSGLSLRTMLSHITTHNCSSDFSNLYIHETDRTMADGSARAGHIVHRCRASLPTRSIPVCWARSSSTSGFGS